MQLLAGQKGEGSFSEKGGDRSLPSFLEAGMWQPGALPFLRWAGRACSRDREEAREAVASLVGPVEAG